jgi:hypothetical protein
MYATCPTHLILLDLISQKIFGEEYRSLSSPLCSLLSCYCVPIRANYPPWYPVIKHLHLTFFSQWDW